MSTLRTQMTQDMIVRGLAKGTQKAYLLAVTELSDYYDQRNPATLSNLTLTPARYTHDLIIDKIMVYGIFT